MSTFFRANKYGFVLWLCLAGTLSSAAQKTLPELKRVADRYRSLTAFSVKVSTAFYSDDDSRSPARHLSGSTLISGNLSRSVFDGRETVLGTDFILVVDHGNRSVYYSPRTGASKKMASPGGELLDSLFLARCTVSERTVDDTYTEYRLVPKRGGTEFRSVTLRINRKEHILDEIVYLYAGEVTYKKVVIRYTGFDPSPKADKSYFSESKFIGGRQKTARLQPAYSDYHLINSFTYDPKKELIDP